MINEHPLLASYSNILVILYSALKSLTKFTGEGTYTWKIYIKLIDMIIAKIIRDLTMNLKNEDDPTSSDAKKKDKEFTIDEEFFHSVIMPTIYSTIQASIRQDHLATFNLLFAIEIALKKTTVTESERDFFLDHFFRLPNHNSWRDGTMIFAKNNDLIDKEDYFTLKKALIKEYSDTRKLFE